MTDKEIIELAVSEGVKAADKRFETLKKKFVSEKKDKRLHNTKLLIRNYRMFKTHAEKSLYSAADCEESVFDILSMMSDREFLKAEFTVRSIENSAVRTAVIVNHVTAMIETYEIWCHRSGKPENERRCRVLRALYIDDNPPSADDLAEREGIDRRTVYKDVDAAVEILAALIFGIDSLKED